MDLNSMIQIEIITLVYTNTSKGILSAMKHCVNLLVSI